MKHYAGLDVSVKETAICIVDESGRICREAKVVSDPEDLSKALTETGFRIERIGLEAGPLSQCENGGAKLVHGSGGIVLLRAA